MKTFESNVAIPRVEDRNSDNNDFNIVAQNDNQHLCLNVILSRKKRPIDYILTFNGSVENDLKVPQIQVSEIITTFIANSFCVLCRTSSRDNITEKCSKKLKL